MDATLALPPQAGLDRRQQLGLGAIWLVVTGYNLFKPFHIDDTVHLAIPRWIVAHPFHPMLGTLNWFGTAQPFSDFNQPHLYFYLLALWGAVFGWSEPAMHALQSLFALLCILSLHRIARRVTPAHALWVTALVTLGPAFITEQNLMVDVPLLSAWLVFFQALICGAGSPRQGRRYAVAGLACAAAVLIKYSGVVLLPVLAAWLLQERRARQAWALLIPLAALAGWSVFNLMDYGAIHLLGRPAGGSGVPYWLPGRALAWVVALGGLTPVGLMLAASRLAPRPAAIACGAVAAAFGVLVLAVAAGWLSAPQADRLLLAAFVVNGLATLLVLAGRGHGLLLLWVVATGAFYILFAPFMAARHLLLVLPAVALLAADRLTRPARVFGLGMTVVISAGLCLSDWRFADFFRTEAADIARVLPAGTGQVWESGHWGWQWYAMQQGFTPVDVTAPALHRGDVLVVADTAAHEALRVPTRVTVLWTDQDGDPALNLFCTNRGARLYLSDAWTGPWSLSRDCTNQVTVYRVLGAKP